jgi:hypothetical protein
MWFVKTKGTSGPTGGIRPVQSKTVVPKENQNVSFKDEDNLKNIQKQLRNDKGNITWSVLSLFPLSH